MAFLLHRWLGIALALLMAIWSLSGIVMLYVSFPETTAAERIAGLEPLRLDRCCSPVRLPEGSIESAVIETVAGRPVLRWGLPDGAIAMVPLDGRPGGIGRETAAAIAQGHLRRAKGIDEPVAVEQIDRDQWTVYGRFRVHSPLFKASFADAAGTVLYVSGASGEIVQDTTRVERFWNWLGAVPHWLYFTTLRQHPALWSNIVVYASLLGVFLTVTGIYVGLRMYRRGPRRSPFRGIALWHHWTGLAFGLLTLTWVASGLASMQPWGLLESEGPGEEMAALAGRPMTRADVAVLVDALASHVPPGTVAAELTMQASKPYAILVDAKGARRLAGLPDLAPVVPDEAELAARARGARPGVPVASEGLINDGDAYHYDHHSSPALLPAWRTTWADRERTRLYLDPRTGEAIDFVDSGVREFRWWHYAPHRLDFAPLNTRPLWDVLMLVLLAGVSLLCLLGVWMGVRRLRRKERVRP